MSAHIPLSNRVKVSMMKNRAFTLIELLVVIAIIGILSAIVLSSLDTARNKAADAAIKSNLDNARAQAANYYDSSGTGYGNVCVTNSGATVPGIYGMLQAAQQASGATTIIVSSIVAGSAGNVTCHDNSGVVNAWAAEAPLKTNPSLFWCVDSTGTSAPHTNHIAGFGGVTCPVG